MSRALPDVPACWTWELPPLPQPNSASVIAAWQRNRCAICGVEMPGARPWSTRLVEDHDHATGDVRGYLCPGCNSAEGGSRAAVFACYRERHPASMLGILARYRCGTHPVDREAKIAWESALAEAEDRRDPSLVRNRAAAMEQAEANGFPLAWFRVEPEKSAMADYADRVGLTLHVWWDVEKMRRDLRSGWQPRDGDLLEAWRYVHRCGEYANLWRPSA